VKAVCNRFIFVIPAQPDTQEESSESWLLDPRFVGSDYNGLSVIIIAAAL